MHQPKAETLFQVLPIKRLIDAKALNYVILSLSFVLKVQNVKCSKYPRNDLCCKNCNKCLKITRWCQIH